MDEWHRVFLVSGGFYAFGAIVYLIFASDKLQTWATFPTREEEKDIKQENKELLVDAEQVDK